MHKILHSLFLSCVLLPAVPSSFNEHINGIKYSFSYLGDCILKVVLCCFYLISLCICCVVLLENYYYAVVFSGIMLLEVCSKVCISRCVWCILSSYCVKIRGHIIHIAFQFCWECAIGNVWKELKGLELKVSNWVLIMP